MSLPEETSTVPKPSRGLMIGGVILAVLAVGVVAEGLVSRAHSANQLKGWTEAQSVPTVHAAPPSSAANSSALQLPGCT